MTFASTAPAPDPTSQHEPAVVEEAQEHFALVVGVFERGTRVAALFCKQHALFIDPSKEALDVRSQVLRTQPLDLRGRLVFPRGVELEDATDAHETLAPDFALGDRRFPIASAAVVPTSDFDARAAIVLEVGRFARELVLISEEQVEHALGIGLYMAAEAAETLIDRLTVFLVEVLVEDVIAVGDHHEEMTLLAGLPALFVTVDGLHTHAGSIGRDAERGGQRVRVHRFDDRLAELVAHELLPAAERAAVDANGVAREAVFDAKQRHTFADVLHGDVCHERGRGHAAGQHLCGHRRGDHIGVAHGVDGLVAYACDDHAPLAAALVRELDALVEAVTHDLAFFDELVQMRVGDLDALFFERQQAQVTATGAAIVCAFAAPLAITCWFLICWRGRLLRHAERAGERIELAQLVCELQLQLRGVDALGLGDEDAALPQLQLLAQALVRCAQVVTLFFELCDALRQRRVLGSALCM